MEDLYCLLGPSIGFNREILLYRRSLQDHWGLPSADMVQAFLWLFDPSEEARAKPLDFSRRRGAPAPESLFVQLRAEFLERQRFGAIHDSMEKMAPESWCFLEYRTIIGRGSACDWQTLGALMYVFHHLDK